jgi:polyisoprenoid-binding protein YceI
MMIATVRGRFEDFELLVDFDEQNPALSKVDLKIAAASINTKEPKRDGHLRSADFLDAEKYPYLTFRSKRIELIDKAHARVVGDLTIRDLTREIALDVEYTGQAKSPWGATSAGFSARTKLNRKHWNLTWNVALETGGWLVGDEITVDIEAELIKQEVAEAVLVAA